MDSAPLVLVANAGDGSITTFRLTDRSLDRLAVSSGLPGCSTFAVDGPRGLVYAGVESTSDGEAGDADTPAGIVTLALDRETGELIPRSRIDLGDGAMNYLALTPDASGLLGASYDGGYGETFPVDDGTVGAPVSRITFPNLHSVLPSADGRFAYFVSLGADLVAQYALDDQVRLHPLDPETVPAPEGSGPRHLVFSPAQDAVYVLTEFSGELLHFSRDTGAGTLDLRDAVAVVDPAEGLGHSAFGADPLEHHYIWGADIHLGDDGRRIWTSERTTSTLAAATVSDDGTITAPAKFFPTEPQPRGFALSSDGRYLVAAGERSTSVSLYAVEADDLRLLQQTETGSGANWVRFV
jgi:6-phosphogluconolactonase